MATANTEAVPSTKKQSNCAEMDDIQLKKVALRIMERKRAASPNLIENGELEKANIERHLEMSDRALAELLRDGDEIISNIKITNDKREVDHRNKQTESREKLLESIHTESEEAISKLHALSARWSSLKAIKDPMGLYEALELQKTRILAILHQKDNIIIECQNELIKADQSYNWNLDKQQADLVCLLERIDQQIETVRTTYKEHLNSLKSAVDNEMKMVLLAANKKWQLLFEKRNDNERTIQMHDKEKAAFVESEIARIQLEHAELTRSTRIRLEQENEALQIEMQNVKADVMLNSQKLNYNYQVLQKRETENVLIRNQQKRQCTRLKDIIVNLQKKVKEIETKSEIESTRMTTEITTLNNHIRQLDDKADFFASVNETKYNNVWDMNYNEARQLLNKVLAIDKVICEQQLGLEWKPPEKNVPNEKSLPSYKEALKIIAAETLQNKTEQKSRQLISPNLALRTNEQKLADLRVLRLILKHISHKSGFLMEDKLTEILEPYKQNDRTLVCIDNVFMALRIDDIVEVSTVKDYFLPYLYCPRCLKPITDSVSTPQSHTSLDRLNVEGSQVDILNQDDGIAHSCKDQQLILKSACVLKALQNFTENHFNANDTNNVVTFDERITRNPKIISRLLATDDVKLFWDSFLQIFSSDKKRLWVEIDKGLLDYVEVLKARETLNNECEKLRRQNTELRFLLQRYLPDTQSEQL